MNSRDAAQRDGFMREVDEAVRQDEMLGAMRRYGIIVAVVVGAALIALAGYLWWQHSTEQNVADRAEKFTIALDQLEAGHLDAATQALKPLAADGNEGSGVAAKLLQAGIAAEQGKVQDAAKLFGEVAKNAAAPQPYRDLATIRQVALQFDSMPADQVVTALKPLAVPGKAWFGSAGELLGMAYMKQGKNELAGPLFASIARDKTVPETLRRRVRQLAGLLGADAIDDVNEAATGTNGAAAPAEPAQP
jgi:hypothetical protein